MSLDESNRSGNETISLNIPKESFVIERRELGKGTLGRVMVATLKLGVAGSETSAKTAAKRLQADEVNIEPSALASWLDRETRVWSSCSHENILKFTGYHIEEDLKTAYLFSPYMRNGDAQVHLAVTRSTVEERFAVLKDTLIGLHYLHNLKPPVVHGDLRAANVLINDNRRAVLTDFGLFTLLDHCRAEPTFPGLMRWFSPELVANGRKRTTKSDMWAWGGLTLEIMMGKPPFWGLFSVSAVKDAILNGQTPEPRPPPQDWPNGLLELVRKCWSQRPEDRPDVLTCIDILNITLSVTECLRGEELELPGGSFIASDRLQSEPNQTLREAGNHTTKIVKLSPTGALVVMKEIQLQELRSTSSRVDFFRRFAQNIAYLSSLKHENILGVIGYSAANGFQAVSLVTPHMASGNLMSYVGKEVGITSKYELARDFTDGLQYLHHMEPPVTHGNLTPFNVLINENGKAVLGDYGLEAIDGYRNSATSLRASIRWSSPEVNIGSSASVQSDIWSWACVVLQLVTGNPPYSYIQAEDQIKAVMLIGKRGHLTPEAYLEPEDKPNILMQLLRRCWEFDFSRRPNVKECVDVVNLMLSGDPDVYSEVQEQQSPDDDISRFITSISPQPLCINGRFGDVFKGVHRTKGEVALKRLRIGGSGADEEVVRRFEREADTWRRLKHPHVLEFLGTYKPDAHLYFVSPFAKNGTLLEYAHIHPSLNRVRLLCETSDAIDYLHRENVVHGDIKASNLLISDDGHILLCDFGLAKPTHAQTSTALKGAGTLRWQSPELWNNEPRTFASDVYAFSMTIVEVLTGLPPFFDLENEVAVIMAVFQRSERPAKIPMESNGVSYENAWKVAEACWPTAPEDRISMSEAFRFLSADPSLA